MSVLSHDLGRLKRRLLVTAIVITTIGIGLLVVLVGVLEGQARDDRLDAELDRRATAARSLIYSDEDTGELRLDGLFDDEAINGSPQVFVVTVARVVVFGPTQRELDVDLVSIAEQAITNDERFATTVQTADGTMARVVALPFYDDTDEEIAGAAVVTGDSSFESAAFASFMWRVAAGAAALVGALSVGGWILINTSLAPAAGAIDQQERFVADAAHELRRPLTALRVTAERGLTSETPGRALQRSIDIVDEASNMVDNLLALARLDAMGSLVDGHRLRLDQIADTVIAEQPDVEMTTSEVVVVTANQSLIEQAIENLVSNSREHGADQISVAVGLPAYVSVTDNGPGFPEHQLTTAFERFRSAEDSDGSGLGLALVAAVARVHGGSASIRNLPEGGAEVTIRLAP